MGIRSSSEYGAPSWLEETNDDIRLLHISLLSGEGSKGAFEEARKRILRWVLIERSAPADAPQVQLERELGSGCTARDN